MDATGPSNRLFSIAAERWRWERFTSQELILLHKPLSSPSFDRYWKQLIGRPYFGIKLFSNRMRGGDKSHNGAKPLCNLVLHAFFKNICGIFWGNVIIVWGFLGPTFKNCGLGKMEKIGLMVYSLGLFDRSVIGAKQPIARSRKDQIT